MKIKDCFIVQDIDDAQYMISVGDATFRGIVKSNSTCAFIINLLKEGAEKEEIVNRILDEYDVERNVVEKDVDKVIEKLHSIDALE